MQIKSFMIFSVTLAGLGQSLPFIKPLLLRNLGIEQLQNKVQTLSELTENLESQVSNIKESLTTFRNSMESKMNAFSSNMTNKLKWGGI